MSNEIEFGKYFEDWQIQSFPHRLQKFGEAYLTAKDINRARSRAERRDLEQTNPELYAEMIAEERRQAAVRRESQGMSVDPLTNPVAAYYAEREQLGLERTADEENADRRLHQMIASGDPMDQYLLEMEVKEVAEFGPKENH